VIIDLLGGTYAHKYADWNSQRTINWYPVITDENRGEKNKTRMALFPRPGLTQLVDLTGDSVRGLFVARTLTQERCFAVVGQSLYEIFVDGTGTSMGAMSNLAAGSNCKVYMEINGNGQLMIMDPNAAYYLTLSTDVLAQITDVDFPGGKTLTYSDGYAIISDNDGRVSFSELNDVSNWVGDSVFTPTFKSDSVKAVSAFREEIYCFGDETTEIYINDGSTPFVRQSRTSMYYGIAAPHSLATWHGGFFFLGSSRFGETEVYMLGTDYSSKQISSPAISQAINQADTKDAEGYVQYTKDGHILYFLHIPALGSTYVYDVTLNMWHERQSTRPYPDNNGDKPQDMFRGRHCVNFKGLNLYGDWYSGKIFKEDKGVTTDDGEIRKLTRTSPVYQNELKYISVYQLEIDMNTGFGTLSGQGSSPVMILKYSLDGGNTFEPEMMMELGKQGEYDYRAMISKLGTARNWVISMEISDPIDIALMQARAKGAFGAW